MTAVTNRKTEWGEYGPAMRALSAKQRAFVEFYLLEAPARGAQTNAARRAGYGTPKSSCFSMARSALQLIRNPKVVDAINEEARKMLRAAAPEATNALLNIVRDPEHKDHIRAVDMILKRTDPEVTTANINVSHRIVDADTEALEELRAARALGATRETLLSLFGGNGLSRLERLEQADIARRADAAQVINGEVAHGTPAHPAAGGGT
jgi:phage terminase small subunit